MSIRAIQFDPKTGVVDDRVVREAHIRMRVPFVVTGESLTTQSHADSCDINKVMARFDRTGALPEGRQGGQYADVTHLQSDFTELVNKSRAVSAEVRDKIRAKQEAAADAARKKAAADAAELAAFRAAKAEAEKAAVVK